MILECPVCGEETIHVELINDSDGDGVYTRHVSYPECTKLDCTCDPTADQWDTLLDGIDLEAFYAASDD